MSDFNPQPVIGCRGCETTAGAWGCPIHRPTSIVMNATPIAGRPPALDAAARERIAAVVRAALEHEHDLTDLNGLGLNCECSLCVAVRALTDEDRKKVEEVKP